METSTTTELEIERLKKRVVTLVIEKQESKHALEHEVRQLQAHVKRLELEKDPTEAAIAAAHQLLQERVEITDGASVARSLWKIRQLLACWDLAQHPLFTLLVEHEAMLTDHYNLHRQTFLDAVSHQCPKRSALECLMQHLREIQHTATGDAIVLHDRSLNDICRGLSKEIGGDISPDEYRLLVERLSRCTFVCGVSSEPVAVARFETGPTYFTLRICREFVVALSK